MIDKHTRYNLSDEICYQLPQISEQVKNEEQLCENSHGNEKVNYTTYNICFALICGFPRKHLLHVREQ